MVTISDAALLPAGAFVSAGAGVAAGVPQAASANEAITSRLSAFQNILFFMLFFSLSVDTIEIQTCEYNGQLTGANHLLWMSIDVQPAVLVISHLAYSTPCFV
jgi:hypothetical protein